VNFILFILVLKIMTEFYKYQGTGNDFVIIDNRTLAFNKTTQQIEAICNRRFGVGADGLILIENQVGFDFKMRYFNSDGLEGSMCGNGGRCAVKFAADLGIFKETTTFLAVDGKHTASVKNEIVSLGMTDVANIEIYDDYYFLNTGSPHIVKFVDNLKNLDVKKQGSDLRYSDFWVAKGGTNVNFVQLNGDSNISVRTYERGVEDETYSCGTGVTASAIASFKFKNCNSLVNINTLGGQLSVMFKNLMASNFTDICLIGPAEKVFFGKI
jgi:diaminopimelate epimerase